ncbi:enolase C-terminal domain-like protein [Actinoplanes sp. NPDC051346]|uniref:enolase C-terminal domain-like protein n=1 Tax=Actinoplanes sp. NPDC051346 TaxID=3155048 RepID=UPI00341D77C1
MADLKIDAIELVDCRDLAGPGDDPFIVEVRAGSAAGWYGPLCAEVAASINALRERALEAPINDHAGLASRLRPAGVGPVASNMSWAIGALDCAVWDVHARAEGVSVAELLGAGGPPTEVPAYASLLSLNVHDDRNSDTITDIAADGWQFTKWNLRPGLGLAAGTDAERLAMAIRRVQALAGTAAAFDALWAWSASLTRHFGALAEPGDIVWLEEPHPHHDAPGYSTASAQVPLGLGERLRLSEEPVLLALPALAAFTVDVVGCGGLTAAVNLVRRARDTGVPVYPHGRSLLPALHLAAAFPDAVPAVEYQVRWQPRRNQLVHHPADVNTGRITIARPMGLGPTPRRWL